MLHVGDVNLTPDYYDALKLGEILVVYGRLMMIGVGGAGKTSLLCALMNEPLPNRASSTLLANACTVKRHFASAGDHAGQNWVVVGEDDEMNELATFLQRVLELQSSPQASSSRLASLLASVEDVPAFEQSRSSAGGEGASEAENHSADEMVERILRAIKRRLQGRFKVSEHAEVLLHIWDSGGQVVFMNILPAFLTSRTLYTLVFDASLDLDEKLTVITHRGGQVVNTEPYHLSSTELLLQWMASIHSHLALQNPDGKLGPYPRVLLVGTRRDKLSGDRSVPSGNTAEKVSNHLASQYEGKYYNEILLRPSPVYIVDNTTAGQGTNEDPAFKEIRERVHGFTSKNLAVRTPLTWVLFRKVMQSICKDGKPVVSYKEAAAIAKACYIPSEALPSVLNFYHELGVFLFYAKIPTLRGWVFTNPQWLISQFAKLLCPHGFEEEGNPVLWDQFRKKGILVDELYETVWSGNVMPPQGLVDLLKNFLLAAPLETRRFCDAFPFEVKKMYFVPCMLSVPTGTNTDGECEEGKLHTRDAVLRAEPLHLTFNTHYVPPGFFVRVVTSLAKSQQCDVLFDMCDRGSVVYAYGEVDEFEVKEGGDSIVIHVIRCLQGGSVPSFAHVCQAIKQLLIDSIDEVSGWFPYVKVTTAFRCKTCKPQDQRGAGHCVNFDSATLTTSCLRCQKNVRFFPTTEQQYWLKQVGKVHPGYYMHPVWFTTLHSMPR